MKEPNRHKDGDSKDYSLDSLLQDYLKGADTRQVPRTADADDDLSSTRPFSVRSGLIPEGDDSIKENLKDFEEGVKKYFTENHDTEVDQKLNALFEENKSGAYTKYIGTVPRSGISRISEVETEDGTNDGSLYELTDEPIDDEEILESEQDELDKKIEHAFELQPGAETCRTKADDCFCGKFKIEYTSPCQDMEIVRRLQKCTQSAFMATVLTAFVTVAALYLEFAPILGLARFYFLEPGKYSPVFALVSLQLLFFCVIFCMDSIAVGAKNLFLGAPTPESAAFLVALASSVQAILSVFLRFDSTELSVFCSIGCFSLFFMSLYEYLKSRSLLMSFRIVSMKKPKFGTEKISLDSPEGETFMKYLADGCEIFTVRKNDFVNNFFSRSQQRSRSDRNISTLLILGAIAGFSVGIFGYVLSKSIYLAINSGVVVFLVSVPASIFLSGALPLFLSSKKAFRTHSALLGLSAGDYYANASVISFDDTAVFPPKQVKVTSVKTYGQNRIDSIIITMSNIFAKLGGPLSNVFEKSVSNIAAPQSDVQLLEVAPDGLRLTVDAEDVLVGTGSFMTFYGLATPLDNIDESFSNAAGSVLYLAKNKELAAKFYIKYTVNNQFEPLLRALYQAGICTGIKTIDPCIDNQLVCANLRYSNYPVSVLKCKSAESMNSAPAPFDTGVVSASGLSNFLKAFILANKLRLTVRSNTLIKLIGVAVGLAVVSFLVATGNAGSLNVLFLFLFQLFWLLPVAAISYLYK